MDRLVSTEKAKEVGGATGKVKYTWTIKEGDEVKFSGDYKGFLYALGLIEDMNFDLEKSKFFTRKKGFKIGKAVAEANGLTVEVKGSDGQLKY
jgi:hypothetical protein